MRVRQIKGIKESTNRITSDIAQLVTRGSHSDEIAEFGSVNYIGSGGGGKGGGGPGGGGMPDIMGGGGGSGGMPPGGGGGGMPPGGMGGGGGRPEGPEPGGGGMAKGGAWLGGPWPPMDSCAAQWWQGSGLLEGAMPGSSRPSEGNTRNHTVGLLAALSLTPVPVVKLQGVDLVVGVPVGTLNEISGSLPLRSWAERQLNPPGSC